MDLLINIERSLIRANISVH